jgi:polyketide biosynthesis acyl carrier protein
VISSVIREILPAVDPAAITGGRHLRDLGADSVDRVEIIIAVLDRLGLDQPLSAFGSLPDIDAMVSLLGELSAGQPAAGGPPGARREGRPG